MIYLSFNYFVGGGRVGGSAISNGPPNLWIVLVPLTNVNAKLGGRNHVITPYSKVSRHINVQPFTKQHSGVELYNGTNNITIWYAMGCIYIKVGIKLKLYDTLNIWL